MNMKNSIKKLTLSAMLVAMSVVIGMFPNCLIELLTKVGELLM